MVGFLSSLVSLESGCSKGQLGCDIKVGFQKNRLRLLSLSGIFRLVALITEVDINIGIRSEKNQHLDIVVVVVVVVVVGSNKLSRVAVVGRGMEDHQVAQVPPTQVLPT